MKVLIILNQVKKKFKYFINYKPLKIKKMARLSNQTIENIAEKMTAQTLTAVQQLKRDYEEIVTCFYEDQIPQAVKTFAKQHSGFIHFGRTVRLEGNGFRWENINTTRPIIEDDYGNAKLEMNAKMAEKIKKAMNKHEDANKSYRTLLTETKQALSALGTNNRIKENLPEAIPFLPPPMSNALVVNFTSLQRKLKLQPDTKKIAAIVN